MYDLQWSSDVLARFDSKYPVASAQIRSLWRLTRLDVIKAVSQYQKGWRAYKKAVKLYDRFATTGSTLTRLEMDFDDST